ncbi:MAG: FtsB family cell division protein [Desulfovibrionales bacterium]
MRLWRWVVVFFLMLDILLLVQLLGNGYGFFKYVELKEHKRGVEERISQVEQGNQRLSREIRLLKSDRETLAQVIRSEMHCLGPGETMYLFTRP